MWKSDLLHKNDQALLNNWNLGIADKVVTIAIGVSAFYKAACKKVQQNRLFSLSYAIVMF
jgi:hypothetical protein